jgi:hypothetical protein
VGRFSIINFWPDGHWFRSVPIGLQIAAPQPRERQMRDSQWPKTYEAEQQHNRARYIYAQITEEERQQVRDEYARLMVINPTWSAIRAFVRAVHDHPAAEKHIPIT